jgi:hypothetical protein
MRAARFLQCQDLGLQGRVAELHHVALGRGLEVRLALDRHHEVVAAGAEVQGPRGGVQQDAVALVDRPREPRVGESGAGGALHLDLELDHAGSSLGGAHHGAGSEPDHAGLC